MGPLKKLNQMEDKEPTDGFTFPIYLLNTMLNIFCDATEMKLAKELVTTLQ